MIRNIIDWVKDCIWTPGRSNPAKWGGEGWFLFIVGTLFLGPLCGWLGASILSWLDIFSFDPSRASGANATHINGFGILYCFGTFFAAVGAIGGFAGGMLIAFVAACRMPEPPHHHPHPHKEENK